MNPKTLKNPQDNPIVSQPTLFRPSVNIQGNREITPSTLKWIRLLSVPTSPLDAFNVSLQWLFGAMVSVQLTLIFPLALQITIGAFWVLLGSLITIAVNKESHLVKDVALIVASVIIGFVLGVL